MKFTMWFEDISMSDIPRVGGKNASLGEMIRGLSKEGVRVPSGFALTADAYRFFLQYNGLTEFIRAELTHLRVSDIQSLQKTGARIRNAFLMAEFPEELKEALLTCYRQMAENNSHPVSVAVRSSATAEDLPESSFAGQQETFLNINNEVTLLDSCKRCFASLFTDRAISYRAERGFDHMQVALSVGIQKMVRSDLASAGVMFSIDTETGFRDVVLINSSYGLGESVVQGAVNPDEFCVFKPTLAQGYKPILRRTLGEKEHKIIYDLGGTKGVKSVPVSLTERSVFSLTDQDALILADWACRIEKYYSSKMGKYTPMDMEWAKDGETGDLYVVQARPETVQSQKKLDTLELFKLKERSMVIAKGRSVGMKIAQGRARVIHRVKDLVDLQPGEILVTEKTDPDWEPAMKKVAAIVTDRGGRTCHAAIVSRELGLPAVIGTLDGSSKIKTGQEITVSCAEGEDGFVYDGILDFQIEKMDLKEVPRPRTKIMMNVSNPDEAFSLASIPNDGVGLAREEFIIGHTIQVHPMALLHFDSIPDPEIHRAIETVTRGYQDKPSYFVDKLAEGVGTIAAAFYPKDVIVRLSDFKTNEYANLLGGSQFEPKEENPMLGFRGASRYYNKKYQDGFALECRAMKKVRDEMGLQNVKLMIPFCRTVEEGKSVLSELAKNGLKQGERGLEVYVMCEIPSNVILADEFGKIFDGFSIGSNDLTQLVLGVDRDSEIVAPIFDENNLAVKKMISSVITAAKASGRKIGICGQAPSDYPEFAAFLVREGIDSLSLSPDAVLKTILAVAEIESSLGKEVNHVFKKSRRGSTTAFTKTQEL